MDTSQKVAEPSAVRVKQATPAGPTSEVTYRDIVEHAIEGIYQTTLQGRIVMANQSLAQMLGYASPAELAAAVPRIQQLYQDPGRRRALLRLLETAGRVKDFEVLFRRHDSSTIWVSISARALWDAGALIGTEGMVVDISRRKAAEEALRETVDRFRELAENIKEVFWMTDAERTRVLYVSPAYETVWGRTRESLYTEPRTWMEAVHPQDRGRVLVALLTKQIQGQYQEEYRILRPDGSVRWILDRAFPITDPTGDVRRIVGIAEDITERKRLEHEILDISEQERQRIGQDLHDGICQRLTGIAFMAKALAQQLASTRPAESARAAQIVEDINRTTTQARELARGLVFLWPNAGSLTPALQELASYLRDMFQVACAVDGDARAPVVNETVATHLYRIAHEAAHNAVTHGQAKHLLIRFTEADDKLVLTIQDDGVGLPASGARAVGLGLRAMHYRAGIIGATLEIMRNAAGGTTITCSLPRTS